MSLNSEIVTYYLDSLAKLTTKHNDLYTTVIELIKVHSELTNNLFRFYKYSTCSYNPRIAPLVLNEFKGSISEVSYINNIFENIEIVKHGVKRLNYYYREALNHISQDRALFEALYNSKTAKVPQKHKIIDSDLPAMAIGGYLPYFGYCS